jgi:hypothetical protein
MITKLKNMVGGFLLIVVGAYVLFNTVPTDKPNDKPVTQHNKVEPSARPHIAKVHFTQRPSRDVQIWYSFGSRHVGPLERSGREFSDAQLVKTGDEVNISVMYGGEISETSLCEVYVNGKIKNFHHTAGKGCSTSYVVQDED